MRHAALLLLALLSACAGPRLAAPTSTAKLPPPAVRRVDAPPATLRVVDVRFEPIEPICDT